MLRGEEVAQRVRQTAAVAIAAIFTLGILEALALLNGIDGPMFGLVVFTIGGIAGYTVRDRRIT